MVTGAELGNYVVGLLLLVGIAIGLVLGLRRTASPRRREADWEPALEKQPEVHVLGSTYPRNSSSYFSGMISRKYTVPKDPEAYAKIFVPDAAEKD